ncbi:MAG: hypothetical protein FWG29_07500, partial [Treponema sp.]|nr:hypothetical protein [Treponema sp.]
RKKNLDNAKEVKDELVKNRVLLNFNQDGVTGEQILKSLRALIIDGCFKAASIIVDGFDFSRTNRERMEAVKNTAKELDLSFWYSCNVTENEFDKHDIPLLIKDYLDLLDVVIVLDPKADHIELTASKDRNVLDLEHMAVKLDPKTLLILPES